MSTIKHPSAYISAAHAAVIREHSMAAEDLKQLHPEQLNIIYQQNWFKLFVPKEYGGLNMALPDALKLEEAIAWADGSVGWTVTLCAGAGWFAGFLQPALSQLLFSDDKVCLAGSGKSSAVAKRIAGGYLVNGHWDYATGSQHATAFTANCVIEEDGVLLTNTDGQPLVQSFLFLKDEVQVQSNWKRIGMIATGSNSFEVTYLFVAEDRSFIIDQQHAVLKNPAYQFPFLQLAETTLAVNSSGMAMRFLELCELLLAEKYNASLQSALAEANTAVEAARMLFYDVVKTSWQLLANNKGAEPDLLIKLSRASKYLAVTARKVVDELYPLCGMQAADPDTELNRVWRNLHTASQHGIFNH